MNTLHCLVLCMASEMQSSQPLNIVYITELILSNSPAWWPNGKALLSGGKDCGFESRLGRIHFEFPNGDDD